MKIILTLICLSFSYLISGQRCATADYLNSHPVNKSVSLRGQSFPVADRDTLNNELIIIPVVVHVLYNTSEQNISDEQIISQIISLNKDYRRLNTDTINTPGAFKSLAADIRIQFCLAKIDPQGNYTSGIIRKYTKTQQFLSDDAMKFSSKSGDDSWDATRYLNIWVCNLFGRTLGYGVLPGSPLDRDGVVIKYNVFGTIGKLTEPYSKGRTATHEIGHWLGLKHLWGDSTCGDDGIADTPPQETSNTYCPGFPHLSSCSINSNGDMFMNFMDFTDDACMNLFTQGQKSVMRGLFATGGPRNSMLNSNVCDGSQAEGGPVAEDSADHIKISTYPNPFNNSVTITSSNAPKVIGRSLKVYNTTGKLIISQIIQSQATTVNTSNLPSGIYIFHIESEDGNFVYKMVKQGN